MFEKEITFDRFVRGTLIVILLVCVDFLLNMLSSVLWQFFLAWLLAYLMFPMVKFLQYKCHLRNRGLSIVVSLLSVLGVFAGLMWVTIPAALNQILSLSDDLLLYVTHWAGENHVSEQLLAFIEKNYSEDKLLEILQQDSTWQILEGAVTQAWAFLAGTINVLLGLVNIFVVLLYLVFILLDYESLTEGWIQFIPQQQRDMTKSVVKDVESSMSSYFRGQGTIAFLVGVLFSIGFLIIGFPLAIPIGLFIGLLNMVPYLQLISLIPVTFVALLEASDKGESFWAIMAMVLVVYAVVQTIQDVVLTPRILGKAMGLNPAIILLSLSVWGCLLGFIGLIIALPLTSLCISYYKRFVLKE